MEILNDYDVYKLDNDGDEYELCIMCESPNLCECCGECVECGDKNECCGK